MVARPRVEVWAARQGGPFDGFPCRDGSEPLGEEFGDSLPQNLGPFDQGLAREPVAACRLVRVGAAKGGFDGGWGKTTAAMVSAS